MANSPSSAVRLELRSGSARPVTYDVTGDEFVIGTVPGCDLRLAGANLPPVLCVISRSPEGPRLRKLAPALPLMLNGRPVQTANLRTDDTISLGPISLIVHTDAVATPQSVSFVPINEPHRPSTNLQEADLAERRRKLDEQAKEMEADRVLWYRRRDELERECREREQVLAGLPERQAEVAAKQQELDKLREELADVRRDLFRQYQERRDRLAGLQQAVQTAARKVQDRKQQIDSTELTTTQLREQIARQEAAVAEREAAIAQREADVAAALQAAETEQKRREDLYQDAAAAVEVRLTECEKREQYLADRDARTQAEWGKLERQRAELELRDKDLAARAVDVTAVRTRDEQLVRLQQQLEADRKELETRDAELAAARADADRRATELQQRTAELQQRASELAASQRETDKLREELAASQKELHQRYQERRDRLAGLQQAVQVAARKVQDAKRELTEQEQRVGPQFHELNARQANLDGREKALAAAREDFALTCQAKDAEHAGIAARLRSGAEQIESRLAECDKREQVLTANEERRRTDLARLDRFQETLEQRERQADATAADVDRQREQLQRDTLELEEQARQLDAAQVRQQTEDERLKQQRIELDAAAARLTERASQVEGQQAMLAALRTRLERTRAEVRQEATLLAEQRVRQEAAERELQWRTRVADELQAQAETESLAHAAERQLFDGRSGEIQAAVTRLRELEEKLSAEETALSQRRERLDAQATEQATMAAELKARAAQVLELQEKLTADRQAVKDREAALSRDEEARKVLQEQLHRRADDLAARQKQIEEQAREFEAKAGQVGEQHEAISQQKQATDAALAAGRQSLDRQMGELQQMAERLGASEANLHRLTNRLKTVGRALAAGKKAHVAARMQWVLDRRATDEDAKRLRAELEQYRKQTAADAEALRQQLPDLELRGQAVLVRLGQAREELRGHLGELHDYTRQGQEDMEAVQARVRAEADRLRDQEAAVNRARAEHRLAVTAFRQQLLEWQGRVADMRRVLADDGTRLERKQAEVSAAAKQVDETAQSLARQAADLQEQERQVGVRRTEMERHLSDMREWYRRKLRELAESGHRVATSDADDGPPSLPMVAGEGTPKQEARTPIAEILSLTDDLDPGDRQLGDLLRSLELVDADTLTALLLDARRQRKSLRQVLLAARGGGSPLLTLYQLALIESGNLDALVLGPTRVIDRLQATQREAVYRVFDPRRDGATVLLRHLAEGEMQDAVHPDEFRQRFAALAALNHPHLAATLEVLEVNGRPAVLQEWLSGLPATDWPQVAAVPAVWHWLVSQTATGLYAAHQAGLVHGRLTARSIVLTPAGVVKVTGCGEPPWLAGRAPDATPADDLAAFGEIASVWATGSPRRKSSKASKALPPALLAILDRLRPDMADRYPSAAELLADLERVGPDLPAMGDAWEKLVGYTTENATDGVAWRKSA